MEKLFEILNSLAPERVRKNEPMSAHTTFKVGGCADICFFPASEEELMAAMKAAQEKSVPMMVMGNGSNMIVRDGGIRGLVIILGNDFGGISVDGNRITCQAGASLARLANAALENSLTGLEFASGIPGTVGGGLLMNAGAYGGELKDVVESVVYYFLPQQTLLEAPAEACGFGYRTSNFKTQGGCAILSAVFRPEKGDKEQIAAKMRELNEKRREKQPLDLPSAGSAFKRPEGHFAAALIEQAGLKGYTVGGAQVSEKHSGFVVNKGNATSKDV